MTVLVLYWYPPGLELRPAVERHLHALDGHVERVVYHNAARGSPPGLPRVRPDAVVLHTTFLCLRWFEDFASHRRRFAWLAGLTCPKLAVPQDEYDHSEVLDEWLAELGATAVFSNFGEDVRPTLYPLLGARARFHGALTGYADKSPAAERASRTPLDDRPHDVVYRASQLPFWFGSHGQLKHRIGTVVAERAPAHGLSTDISTRVEDTILGDRWWEFLGSGRVVLGCESGSSVLDRRGEIQRRIRRLLAVEPGLSFEQVSARMPEGWDSWSFFAISPRHLEAILTWTCQVLVEGSYSGVLEPHRHFLPLRRDLADLDEVLEQVRDVELLERIATQAYEDVVLSGRYTYDVFAGLLRSEMRGEPARPTVAGHAALAGVSVAERASGTAPARALRRATGALARIGGSARSLAIVARGFVRRPALLRIASADPQLLADLRRLEALRASAGPVQIGLHPGAGTVVVSSTHEDAGPADAGRLEEALAGGASIVWIGERIERFDALAALGRERPAEVACALSEAARGAGRR